MSEHDGGPGELVEQARVVRSAHEADHARHRQVLERLDRVIALLERLVQAAERQPAVRGAARGPSRPR